MGRFREMDIELRCRFFRVSGNDCGNERCLAYAPSFWHGNEWSFQGGIRASKWEFCEGYWSRRGQKTRFRGRIGSQTRENLSF